MKSLVSVNGVISSMEEATIPAIDRGFLFADSVFETLVCIQGHILNLHNHLNRLRISARDLLIPVPWRDEELIFELEELARQVGDPKVFIRLVVSRGSGFGLPITADLKPNKVVFAGPAKREEPSIYKKGVALQRRRLPSTERGPSAKTGNYLRSILALKVAGDAGYDDVLWSNFADEITEATTANIFFVERLGNERILVTPSPHSGILKGITRETVIRLAAENGIATDERVIVNDELARFEEAFLTSTVRGLVPIYKIDIHDLHTNRAQSVFNKVRGYYMEWVVEQVGFQVDWNSGEAI